VETAGKILLGAAIVLAVFGAILFGLAKLGVERLPGDESATRPWHHRGSLDA
jgi:hypothetical protein